MLAGLSVDVPLGEPKVNHIASFLLIGQTHKKVVWLDVPVQKAI